jgi:MinD-like ATPase involved in chromosome partitioning or flagellar assembly
MSWGMQGAPVAGSESAGAELRVTLVVAGRAAAANSYYSAFLADARFNVLAMATSAEDVRAKLAGYRPEAVIVDGTVFNGVSDFAAAFASYPGACFLLLPGGAPAEQVETARQVPCVQEVLPDTANLPELAGKLYAAVLTRRRTAFVPGGGFTPPTPAGAASLLAAAPAMAGWRSIAVWSMQGGVGKSTLALALAFEAASRRLPALLVGLAAPDMTPLVLGPKNIKPEPNIMAWRANPTVDGLRAAVQHYDVLDVLVGFRDPLALAAYTTGSEAMEGNTSLHSLANCAAFAGKAVVIFDVSAPELAAPALSSANTLVLVARPDLPGIQSARDAVHLVHEKMGGRHRIPPEATYLIVNRTRQSTLRAEEVAKHGAADCPNFPALVAYVPDDPAVEEAVRGTRPAYYQSAHLRQAVKALGDLLFAGPPAGTSASAQPGKPLLGGLIRVKVRS